MNTPATGSSDHRRDPHRRAPRVRARRPHARSRTRAGLDDRFAAPSHARSRARAAAAPRTIRSSRRRRSGSRDLREPAVDERGAVEDEEDREDQPREERDARGSRPTRAPRSADPPASRCGISSTRLLDPLRAARSPAAVRSSARARPHARARPAGGRCVCDAHVVHDPVADEADATRARASTTSSTARPRGMKRVRETRDRR